MESEINPEEKIKESLGIHQMYLSYVGNLRLNDKIIEFVNSSDLAGTEARLIPAAKSHFKTLVAELFLSKIFDIAMNVHYFHASPSKVVDYVKASLNLYATSLRRLFHYLLLEIVKDKNRFDFENESISYIIQQLEKLDIDYIEVNFPTNVGVFEYFTGKDHIPLNDSFIHSFLAVRGFIEPKETYYIDFIKDNFSPELINAIKHFGFELNTQKEQGKTNKQKLDKLLSADILELKPNIAGIGINVNELINRLKNKHANNNNNKETHSNQAD